MEYKVLGLDVSKDNVCCHVLENYPAGGLGNYWRKSAKNAAEFYPRFYSNPKGDRQKSLWDFVEFIKEHKPNLAVLEPTGVHYSRIFYQILKTEGVTVKWVGHMELKRYREGKNLPGHGKNDAVDALAMAAYPFDPEHLQDDGTLNERYFLLSQPEPVMELRELVQQLEHLARVQSPIINYARQRLTHEFPEAAFSKASSSKYVPAIWGFLGDMPEHSSKSGLTLIRKKYADSIVHDYGLEIDPITKCHARWLTELCLEENRIEQQVIELLRREEFLPYMEVFDLFGFGLRIGTRLLTRCYPFESFLLPDGKEWIDREHREVKRVDKSYNKGTIEVEFKPGDVKVTKKNRSRDAFKMRLGQGTIMESSGDGWIEKAGGSAICRQSLYLHVLTRIESSKGNLPENEINQRLIAYRDDLKSQVDGQGKPTLRGKHIQAKIMSKVVNMLYSELLKRFKQ